jgi:hypothetical protein
MQFLSSLRLDDWASQDWQWLIEGQKTSSDSKEEQETLKHARQFHDVGCVCEIL